MLNAHYKQLCFLIVSSFCLCFTHLAGATPVLKWNGGSNGAWDVVTANWLDENDNPVVWVDHATALFASGDFVNITDDIVANDLHFDGHGLNLVGVGHLTLSGDIVCAANTTNSVTTPLIGAMTIHKRGTGALALAQCSGTLAVEAGSLIVCSSLAENMDLSVAAGAKLITLGGPSAAANLVQNGSFEEPQLSNGSWAYRDVDAWESSGETAYIGLRHTGAGGSWSQKDVATDGQQVLILQGGGAISQTIAVAESGLYAISLDHMMRGDNDSTSANRTNLVNVLVNDTLVARFLCRARQPQHETFVSSALWLPSGSYKLTLAGPPANSWADRTTLMDDVRLAPPSTAEACRALGGDSMLALTSGASVFLGHENVIETTLLAINGMAQAGGFIYDSNHLSGIFAGTGAIEAFAPEKTFIQSNVGNWSDSSTWAGGVVPVGADSSTYLIRLYDDAHNNVGGNFLLQRLQLYGTETSALTGNGVSILGPITQVGLGDWSINAPLTFFNAMNVYNNGDLRINAPISISADGILIKEGLGTLHIDFFANTFKTAVIYGGTVALATMPLKPSEWHLNSSANNPTTLCFTGDGIHEQSFVLNGCGSPTLATAAGGAKIQIDNWVFGNGMEANFNVGAGDTLSMWQMVRMLLSNKMQSETRLVKSGAGTLAITSGGQGSTDRRAYYGNTILRNGTLVLYEDDWGTLEDWTNPFNARTYSEGGGSLGYNAFENAVAIGDDQTALGDELALIAAGDQRWIGHDIEVFDKGATVTLGMTEGVAKFNGTVTLHRSIDLMGPGDGILAFNNIALAPDFNGIFAPTLNGLAGLVFEEPLPPTTTLELGARYLSIGTHKVCEQILQSFSAGSGAQPGLIDFDFSAGVNDTITTTLPDGLTLGAMMFNLYYAGFSLPFHESGTYELFYYNGTFNGDTSLFSVGNPAPGCTYVFANDTVKGCLTLTIENNAELEVFWRSPTSGTWQEAVNWDNQRIAHGIGVAPVFGNALRADATVELQAQTVGGILLQNLLYSYTLKGGELTMDNAATAPFVTVSAGEHAIDASIINEKPLEIAVKPDSLLSLVGDTSISGGVHLEEGRLQLGGRATISNLTTLAEHTTLSVMASGGGVGSIAGPPSSTLAMLSDASRLTISPVEPSTFSGLITGTEGLLIKDGSEALTLDNPLNTYQADTAVNGGTLALQGVAYPSTVSVAANGILAATPAASSGLMGYFYNVAPDTNAFWTLGEMETHFATMQPAYAALSGEVEDNFNYGVGTPYAISGPYATHGGYPYNYETVWRGTIEVPTAGNWMFAIMGDDGYLLAINGKQVLARNYWNNSFELGSIVLDAGQHDIVIGYFQKSGGGGLQLRYKAPGEKDFHDVPNTWLRPYAEADVSQVSGSLDLTAAPVSMRLKTSTRASFDDAVLSGGGDSLWAKAGMGLLTLSGDTTINNFVGRFDLQKGAIASLDDQCLGANVKARLYNDTNLGIWQQDTLGSIQGSGALSIGSVGYTMPFSDDADCDISPDKTYTHLLDFPDNGAATVNGVAFTSAGAAGSVNGYAWEVENMPNAWNSAPNDTTRSGIDRLTWDFVYGNMDFTINLHNLIPGKVYETRLYFRNFSNSPRNVIFSFTDGVHKITEVAYNPDSVPLRSWVACRYTATQTGKMAVRVQSLESGHKCHFYALSNEEVATTSEPSSLTLTPPSNSTALFDGSVSGSGKLKVSGAGTQHFSNLLDLADPIAVDAGTMVLEPGAIVPRGVEVAANAALRIPMGGVTLGQVAGTGTIDLTEISDALALPGPQVVFFSGDADCGISSNKVYTHLLDFGNSGNVPTINGVTFNKVTSISGLIGAQGWHNAPAEKPHGGGNPNRMQIASSESIYHLLNDFTYGGPYAPTVMKLTGLTVGKVYEIRFYHRAWEEKERVTIFTFNPGGEHLRNNSIRVNPDRMPAHYVAYRYRAQSDQLEITIEAPNADKYHLYGLSNEEVSGELIDFIPEKDFGNVMNPRFVQITGDADSGISPHKRYTHLLDFGSSSEIAVVNGVVFNKESAVQGPLGEGGWRSAPAGSTHAGGNTEHIGIASSEGIFSLLNDFSYGGSTTMRLNGLTIGKSYEVRLYHRKWDNKDRQVKIAFDAGGANGSDTLCVDTDKLPAHYLAYRYVAQRTYLNITFTVLGADSYHLFGLSNEESPDFATTLEVEGAQVFDGVVTGSGALKKSGGGSIIMTGANTLSGPISVRDGGLGVATGGTATHGPVVVYPGAVLFGDGNIGRDVFVTSNAVLHAGTPTTCGTLRVGNELFISSGGRIAWRFESSKVSDTITADGVIILPESGLIEGASLNGDILPPARAILLSSLVPIQGPATLDNWEISGYRMSEKSILRYSPDRRRLEIMTPQGMQFIIR